MGNSGWAVINVDHAGLIVGCSAQVRELFGYDTQELVGKPIELLVAPEVRDEHVAQRDEYRANPAPRFMGERTAPLLGVTKTGQYVELDIGLCPVGGETVCIIRDLGSARAAAARAVASERLSLLSTLSAGIAHELSNPLSAIMAELSVALAELGHDHPGIRKSLETSLEAADHLCAVVRDIELLGRPSRDDELVNVNECAALACRLVLAARRSDVPIRTAFGQVHPVRGNATRLSQAVVNLLLNAVHAVEQSARVGGDVIVRSSSDDRVVVIEVEDTGTGIPADVLPRVFDPFFTTKGAASGSGLGLFLVRTIIRDAGGQLDIDTSEDSGTTVRMALPVAALTAS